MGMIRNTFVAVFGIFCLLPVGSITISQAAPVLQSRSSTVTGTKRSQIGEYVAWRTNCTSKPLKLDVIEQPKHGKLSMEKGLVTVSHVTTGTIDDCKGRKIDGIRLFYKAAENFKGNDVFKLRYRYVEPDDEPVIETFTVTVE